MTSLAKKEIVGFNDALGLVQQFSKLGSTFFPQLSVLSSSIGLLRGLIGGGKSSDQRIIKELTEIKNQIDKVQDMIKELVPQIRQDIIKQRFTMTIQNKINQVQKMYDEFAKNPDKSHQDTLYIQCVMTNSMKNVLTDIHSEIVTGGVGTYNELLDGGVSLSMVIFTGRRKYIVLVVRTILPHKQRF